MTNRNPEEKKASRPLQDDELFSHAPTAAEVAKRAGVSIFTVQRVYSRPKRVAEATRERVLAAAHKLGYSPNVAGRALRTGKVGTVALVLLTRRLGDTLGGDTFAGLYHEISKRGLDVLVSIVPDEIPPERWLHMLVSTGRCDALAIHLETISDETLQAVRQFRIPITLLYYVPEASAEDLGVSYVGFDNVSGIEQAVRHVIELGHRRIAYFGGTPGWPDTASREKGFRMAMAEAGLSIPDHYVVDCKFQIPNAEESGADALNRSLAHTGPKPTAIVCASDRIARGVINDAKRWGKLVPADLSVTGFDNDTWTPYHTPALTTIKYSSIEIGEAAGKTIMDRYEDLEVPPRSVILPTQLVVRESTAPPRG